MFRTYYELPVFFRISIAVTILVIIMISEKVVKREHAYRWKGYSVWLIMALLGMLYGFILDLITIHISPEYYRVGKGVSVENIWLACINVGGAAGFLAGSIMGGIILIRNKAVVILNKNVPWNILKSVQGVFLLATIGALLGFLCPLFLDPISQIARLLDPKDVTPFFKVQQIHAGAYLGALLGFLVSIRK